MTCRRRLPLLPLLLPLVCAAAARAQEQSEINSEAAWQQAKAAEVIQKSNPLSVMQQEEHAQGLQTAATAAEVVLKAEEQEEAIDRAPIANGQPPAALEDVDEFATGKGVSLRVTPNVNTVNP